MKLPDTSSEKRIVVQQADGLMRICGVAPTSTLELCNQASFVDNRVFPFTKEGASLIRMYPRYALYRELVVPVKLKRFDGMQR